MTDMIGFIGVGTMGEPMCRNLATQERHDGAGGRPRPRAAEAARGRRREDRLDRRDRRRAAAPSSCRCRAARKSSRSAWARAGCCRKVKLGWTVIDLSTAPVTPGAPALCRVRGQGLGLRRRAGRAHAPGRDRRHAVDHGRRHAATCFARIEPLLRHMASEVTHCGEAGAGQAVKILNNMILFQTVRGAGRGAGASRAPTASTARCCSRR